MSKLKNVKITHISEPKISKAFNSQYPTYRTITFVDIDTYEKYKLFLDGNTNFLTPENIQINMVIKNVSLINGNLIDGKSIKKENVSFIEESKIADEYFMSDTVKYNEIIDTKDYKFDSFYMDVALRISQLSYANKKKVGAIIVNDENIISYGYNGTPKGFDNAVETLDHNGNLITKDEVIHAELNAILKASKSGTKLLGATLYITLSPCCNCALLIIQSGIKKVVYLETYRNTKGIDILNDAGIEIINFNYKNIKIGTN